MVSGSEVSRVQEPEPGLRERPGDQQLPVPNGKPSIQSLVRADIDAREQVGIQRYGTPLQPHNGRDAMRDAYEEALDLTCYLRQVIAEREEPASAEIARLLATVAEQDVTIARQVDLIAELRRQLVGAHQTIDRLSREVRRG